MDFFLPRRLFFDRLGSSTCPKRKSSARVWDGEMAEMACHNPIHSRYDRGLETTLVKEPLTAEISTDGNDSPLTMVMPLADKDWDMFIAEDEPSGELLELSGDEMGDDGMIGRLKHPSNSSGARIGCQGGKGGSETIEKIAWMSSKDRIPSLLESN